MQDNSIYNPALTIADIKTPLNGHHASAYANMEAHQHLFGVKSKTNIPSSKLHS